MFRLVIFCLTTSNLPSFMNQTFQVPMKYHSLQHHTLLLSIVISTVRCFFFLWLHLFLYIDFQKHIGPQPTWRVDFSVSYLFGFSYCSWSFQSKNIERVFHFPYPMDHILPEFSTMSNPSYMALHGMSHRCIQIDKAVII